LRNCIRFRFLLIAFLVGCGSSGGLRGCESEETVPFVRTSTNVVENSVQTVITSQGVQFAYENRTALVSQLLSVDENGWAALDVPPFEAGDDRFGVRGRDIAIGLHVPSAQLDFEILDNPLRIRLDISNARMRMDSGVIGLSIIADGACRVENGIQPDTEDASFAVADVSLILTPQIDQEGRVQVEVTLQNIEMTEFNIQLAYDETLPECRMAECEFVCSLSVLGAELTETLYDTFRSRISDILAPVMTTLINERLAVLNNQSLMLEGVLKPSSLPGTIPIPKDAHGMQYLVKPGQDGLDYVDGQGQNPGVGITLDVGTESVGHPCVPQVVGEPPFAVGPAPILSGIGADGHPYHLGVSVAEATLNRALWSAWRAGMLCLTLDSEAIEEALERRIDTDTLSIFLPSLSVLNRTPKPVMVVLDPKFSKANFPIIKLQSVSNDQGIPQAGMAVQLPNLGIDMYAYLEDRWTRLTGMRVDVNLDLIIQATPNNELTIVGDAPTITNLFVEYNELLEADDLQPLLRALLDLILGSLLSEGLNFQFGLDGLLSTLADIPYDAVITSITTAGQVADHLNIFFAFEPAMAESGLTAGVDTRASLQAMARDSIRVNVAAPGAHTPLYQYRIEDSLWRPLESAVNGQLTINDPMLKFADDQTLLIRAVDKGHYRSLDTTPVEINVPSARERNTLRLSPLDSPTTGCSVNRQDENGTTSLLALLICLGFLRRPRRWIAIAAVILLSFGCEDTHPAPDVPCVDDSQCPGGLICLGNICQPERSCGDDSDCCVLQNCQSGVCRDFPPDACSMSSCPRGQACAQDYCFANTCSEGGECGSGAQCVEGACIFGIPCQGTCSSDQACFVHRGLCRKSPTLCTQNCAAGLVKVVINPQAYDGPVCNLESAECRCVESFGDRLGSIARQADMALLNGRPVFASLDPDHDDLVFIEGADTDAPIHTYLDGLPGSENQALPPSTSRMGLIQPGPRRGYYPQIEVDQRGRVHIAYYDLDDQSLRYLRREESGVWVGPIVVDEGGDAGRYVQLRVEPDGRSHLIYTALTGPGGESSIRYTVGSNAAVAPQNFEIQVVSSRPTHMEETTPFGLLPTEYGVRPCMTLDGRRVVLAFHDAVEGKMYLAAGTESGFQVEPLNGDLTPLGTLDPGGRYTDFEQHRVGEHCALVSRDGLIDLVFTNERTWSLMGYQGTVQGPGLISLVDPGPWGSRRYIGASPAMAYDPVDRPVIVYQDSSMNDLRLNVLTNNGWLESATIIDDQGAIGFSNSVVISGSDAMIGTVRLSTAAGSRETSTVDFYSVDLTQY
jgi:hypothetical protein